MKMQEILGQIDAEIKRLMRVREIVRGLSEPVTVEKRLQRITEVAKAATPPEPQVIVLPPRRRREYRRVARAVHAEATALAGRVPDRPVFVPRAPAAQPAKPVSVVSEVSAAVLEAAFRRQMLGGNA